jgi:hypothetical protein
MDKLRDLHHERQGEGPPEDENDRAILEDFYRTHGFPNIAGHEVIQHQGKGNAEPDSDYKDRMDEFFNAHDIKPWEQWWDDDTFRAEGPDSVYDLLHQHGNDFSDSEYMEGDNDWWRAQEEAERHGVEGPYVTFGEPRWDRIIEDLGDHGPLHWHWWNNKEPEKWDERGGKDIGWGEARGDRSRSLEPYSPELGEAIHSIASNQWNNGGQVNVYNGQEYDHRNDKRYLENFKHALRGRRDELAYDYDLQEPGSDDIEAFHSDPHVKAVNHLGQLTFGTQWDPVHPEWLKHPWYQRNPTQQNNPDLPNFQPQLDQHPLAAPGAPPEAEVPIWTRPNRVFGSTKLSEPVYYRWAMAPSSGEVYMAHNHEDHPSRVRTHGDLAAEISEANAPHGYAYRIDGGWRLLDYEHKPLTDPYVKNRVLNAIVRREGDPAPGPIEQAQPDFGRFQYGIPRAS